MIDEKKLIEDILQHENVLASANHVYKSGYRDRQYEIIDTIKRQPKVGEWIPCSERLPENISTVIVQLKEVEKPTLGWFGNLTGWRLTENDYLGLTGFSVIAWQPLPEPMRLE